VDRDWHAFPGSVESLDRLRTFSLQSRPWREWERRSSGIREEEQRIRQRDLDGGRKESVGQAFDRGHFSDGGVDGGWYH
jgi:hypothetical protein